LLSSFGHSVASPFEAIKSLFTGDYARQQEAAGQQYAQLEKSGTPEEKAAWAKDYLLQHVPLASTIYKLFQGNPGGAVGDVAGMVPYAALGAVNGEAEAPPVENPATPRILNQAVAGIKAAAPKAAMGAALVGTGELLAKVPGMELPARIGLGYPGARQFGAALREGVSAFKAVPRGGAELPEEPIIPSDLETRLGQVAQASRQPMPAAAPAPPPNLADVVSGQRVAGQPTAPDPLLDQIAQGFKIKSFQDATPNAQAIILGLAEKIRAESAPPAAQAPPSPPPEAAAPPVVAEPPAAPPAPGKSAAEMLWEEMRARQQNGTSAPAANLADVVSGRRVAGQPMGVNTPVRPPLRSAAQPSAIPPQAVGNPELLQKMQALKDAITEPEAEAAPVKPAANGKVEGAPKVPKDYASMLKNFSVDPGDFPGAVKGDAFKAGSSTAPKLVRKFPTDQLDNLAAEEEMSVDEVRAKLKQNGWLIVQPKEVP